MSAYFSNFPKVDYFFGEEGLSNRVENIGIFSDVIDQIKDASTAYQDYYILPDERPDQVSFKLYGSINYYWTFWLMNNHIREQGWPLSNAKIYEFAVDNYTEKVLDTQTVLTDKYAIGESVEGLTTFATGTIVHRNLDLGQIWVKSTNNKSFQNNEIVRTTTSIVDEILQIRATSDRLNAVHHYENADGEYEFLTPNAEGGVDLTTGSGWIPVTIWDTYIRKNDALRTIRVLTPTVAAQVQVEFNKLLRQG